MATEKLSVILELISGQYKREAREAAAATGSIGQAAATASGGTAKLSDGMSKFVDRAKGAALAAVGVAIVKFGVDSVNAASNLEESMNAVNVVFGEASERIHTFGQVSAQAVGLSTREFNQLATVTGAMLTNLGMNADAAGKETIRLTQRASDMASVFNTDVPTAMAAINSALKGEANPIEQFGVKLNDAAVRARAVELGLAATTSQVDANAKAAATLSLIYEQTNKTAGDFAKTSDSLANSQRRAAAAMENAQARFGKAVTPVLANLMDRFAEGIERVAFAFGDKAAGAALTFNEAMKEINDEMAAGTLGTEDLANAILHIAANSDLTTSQLETLATAAGLGADQWDVFADSMLNQMEAAGMAPELMEEVANAIGGVGLAAGETAAGLVEAVPAFSEARGVAMELREANRLAAQSYRTELTNSISAFNTFFSGAVEELELTLTEMETNWTENQTQTERYFNGLAALAALGLDDLVAEMQEGGIAAVGAVEELVENTDRAFAWEQRIEEQKRNAALMANALANGLAGETNTVGAAFNRFGISLADQLEAGFSTADLGNTLTQLMDLASGGPGGSGPTNVRPSGGTSRFSHAGGIIPGPRGTEQLVLAQAGERIIPLSQQNQTVTKNGPTIIVQSPMNDFRTDLQYASVIASVKNLVEAF